MRFHQTASDSFVSFAILRTVKAFCLTVSSVTIAYQGICSMLEQYMVISYLARIPDVNTLCLAHGDTVRRILLDGSLTPKNQSGWHLLGRYSDTQRDVCDLYYRTRRRKP